MVNNTPTNSVNEYPFNLAPVMLTECIIGVLLNSLLLIVIIRNPLKNLRKRGCGTITSLGIADLVTNLGGIGLCFYDYKSRGDLVNPCAWPVKLLFAIVHAGFSASFFMLFLLSVEVYIVTRYRLTAHIKLTKRKKVWAIIFLWLTAIFLGISNFWREDYLRLVFLILSPVVEIAVMTVIIFRILVILNMRRNRREIGQFMTEGSQTDNGLTVSFLLLFIVYLVTAFPYFVVEQVHMLWHMKPEWNVSFDHAAIAYAQPLAYINYVINPLIYAYRMPDYRNSLISLLTCRKRTHGNVIPKTPVSDRRAFQTFYVNEAFRSSNENSLKV